MSEPIERNCIICGEELRRHRGEREKWWSQRQTCSKECKNELLRQKKLASVEKPSIFLQGEPPPVARLCAQCDYRPPREGSDFCSDFCLNAYYAPKRKPLPVPTIRTGAATCASCPRIATNGKYCSRHGQ